MIQTDFTKALAGNDINALALVPKSDLHNHSMLGTRFATLEKYTGKQLRKPPLRMPVFDEFENYLNDIFKELIPQKDFFPFMIRAAFQQATDDGIKVLQMSIDSRFIHTFPGQEKDIIEIVEKQVK